MGLSRSFPALTPLSLRRTRAAEVFLLTRRYNEYAQRELAKNEKNTADGASVRRKGGKKIIRRPAGDDWF